MGVDLGVEGRFFNEVGDELPSPLRTWWEPGLPVVAEYEYEARDGKLRVTTAQRCPYRGQWVVDQWTGESGVWVEVLAGDGVSLRYHCNHRDTSPRTFEDLVFDLTVW